MNQYQYVKLFTFPLYLASLLLKLNLGRIKLTNRNWCEIALEILDSVFQGILIKSPCKGILKNERMTSLLIFAWNLDSRYFCSRSLSGLSWLWRHTRTTVGAHACFGWGWPDAAAVSLARVEGGRELGSTAAHMLLQASLERPGAVNVYYYKQFLKKRFYF